jgi:hypothetical protein
MMSTNEWYERIIVAEKLRELATLVENNSINGFKVEWEKGKNQIDYVVKTKHPVDFIRMDFTVKGAKN